MFVPRHICNTLNKDVSVTITYNALWSLFPATDRRSFLMRSRVPLSLARSFSSSLHRFLTFFSLLPPLPALSPLCAAADSGFLRQISESSILACEVNLSD